MSFHSYFWTKSRLSPELETALERLHAPASPTETRLEALAALLDAESTPARGIALDQYTFAQAQRRFGEGDDLAPLAPRVRACLVAELKAPPFVCPEPDASPRVGANHASAFFAMWHLASADDAALVARALAANTDPTVLEYGVQAAEVVLQGESVLDVQLVDELRRLVNGRDLPVEVRAGAITALGVSACEDVVPWLLDALVDPELQVATAAARCLLERAPERFRDQVAAIAARWPEDDAPYDVVAVRELLE